MDAEVAAQMEDASTSENSKVQQLIEMLERAFDLPSIKGRSQSERVLTGQNTPYLSSLDTAQVKYQASPLNRSAITNPRAVLEVFRPDVFLKSGLSEMGQCRIIDHLMDIINLCY